jgi:hypothetical protein
MSGLPRVGDLEIVQDLAHQKREWRFERAGWAVLAVLVALALLGLFGDGPLSERTLASADGQLRIEYDRFLRREAPATLRVHVAARPSTEVRVWLGRDYLERVNRREISPLPQRVEEGPARHEYVFRLASADTPLTVVFRLTPESIGTLLGQIGIGEARLEFSQFVYP